MITRLLNSLPLFLRGVAMGIADIIPGVSGGTIALISGIYNELIQSLSQVKISNIKDIFYVVNSFVDKAKREEASKNLSRINWTFLVPLFIGIAGAIIIMSKIIPSLLKSYPQPCSAFFFGLILFSIPSLFREIEITFKNILFVFIFAGCMFLLINGGIDPKGSTYLPYVFLSGSLAICAMVLPGISGSYILVLLGEYQIILEALNERDLFIVLTFILGMVVGLYSFLKALQYLLDYHRSLTMAAMIGIMIGGIKNIWPYSHIQPENTATTLHIQISIFILSGALISFLLDQFNQKAEKNKIHNK